MEVKQIAPTWISSCSYTSELFIVVQCSLPKIPLPPRWTIALNPKFNQGKHMKIGPDIQRIIRTYSMRALLQTLLWCSLKATAFSSTFKYKKVLASQATPQGQHDRGSLVLCAETCKQTPICHGVNFEDGVCRLYSLNFKLSPGTMGVWVYTGGWEMTRVFHCFIV